MRSPAAPSPKNSSGAPAVELRVMKEAGSDLVRVRVRARVRVRVS